MKLRELAELALVGRSVARRTGQHFNLDPYRVSAFGFTKEQVAKAEAASDEIEAFTEFVLRRLDQ